MPCADLSGDHAAPPGLPVPQPKGCSNFRLHTLMRRIDQLYDAELAQVGLRTTQYSLLSHVVRLGPIRPGELALAMHLQPSTVTRNLQPLIAAGWVQAGAGIDGRSRSISATISGREKRAQAQRRWKGAQTALNAALGPQRVATLHTLLDQCMIALDAIGKAGTQGPATGLPGG